MRLTEFARLFRVRLALFNGLAAVAGCLLYGGEADTSVVAAAFFGVTLLAAGASALNQVLEADIDRLMARTKRRPIPQGMMTKRAATVVGVMLALAGTLLLWIFRDPLPPLLGMLALVVYLALYTPLKRKSSIALVVGAVCGAIPPVIGWRLSGGSPTDYRIILFAGILYLWQIPHFWLIQRQFAGDYRSAGLPHVVAGARTSPLPAVFRLWVVALAASAMLLPAFGLVPRQDAAWCLLVCCIMVAATFLRRERFFFLYINLFPLLVAMILFTRQWGHPRNG